VVPFSFWKILEHSIVKNPKRNLPQPKSKIADISFCHQSILNLSVNSEIPKAVYIDDSLEVTIQDSRSLSIKSFVDKKGI